MSSRTMFQVGKGRPCPPETSQKFAEKYIFATPKVNHEDREQKGGKAVRKRKEGNGLDGCPISQ